MELSQKITQELIDEVLAEIFPNKDILDKSSSSICYNKSIELEIKSNYKSTLVPFTSNSRNVKSRKTRAYINGKIKGLRVGNHYRFCGKMGHIKNTCFKEKNKPTIVPKESLTNKQFLSKLQFILINNF